MTLQKLCFQFLDTATPYRTWLLLEHSHCVFLITMQNGCTPRIQTLKWPHWPRTSNFLPLPDSLIFPTSVLCSHCPICILCQVLSSLTNHAPPRPLSLDPWTAFSLAFLPAWCFLIMFAYVVIWHLCFRNKESDNSGLMEGNSRFWFITQETSLREKINSA